MTLLKLGRNHTATISKLADETSVDSRLNSLGFQVGKKIRLLRTAPFHGPLLIEDVECGSKIMIGRDIASKIEVSGEKGR